ncbi:MAG: tetratricopeptide repeat protein, partial [Planctomycetota bacterium]
MKLTESIMAVTMLLACGGVCRAGERFAEAQEELACGRYEAAAGLFRLETRDSPTPEGLNNLGVCLERMGRFGEAEEAFRRASALPGAGEVVQQNRRRAVIRSLLQTFLPYAAGFVVVMVLLVIVRWLRRMRGGWRRRTFFDRVRVVDPVCRLLLRDGSVRPDLFVTEDVCRIAVSGGLAIPAAGAPAVPVAVLCEIRDPGGHVRKAFRASPGEVSAGRPGISFVFDDMAAMMSQPGTWVILIALENTGRFLGRFELPVVTTSQLEADLELRDLCLVVRQEGRWKAARNVMTDADSLAPIGVIRPRTYPPYLYLGMEVTYGLIREGTGDADDPVRVPMNFDNG